MPERFCTMYEKCKFLSMGYQHISKVIAKDTNNTCISYTVRYGFGGKAQLVINLPCMQIFVIWDKASWQLTMYC